MLGIDNNIRRMVEDERESIHDEYEVDDYPVEDYVAQDRADFSARVTRELQSILRWRY